MKYFLPLLLIFFTYPSLAQKFSVSADLQLSIPQGDYKDVNPDAGYGLRANVLYRPSVVSPVKFGIEFGIQEKARATEYFSGYVYGYYDDFKVSATSNIFSLMVIGRIQSAKPRRLKPFIDITGGWNVFFSTVRVEDLGGYGYDNYSYSRSTKAHWAAAYGAAGGLDISLDRRDGLGLELKVAYLIGGNTSYLTNPYIDGNGDVSFEENNSRTTMLIPQAGIRITIR